MELASASFRKKHKTKKREKTRRLRRSKPDDEDELFAKLPVDAVVKVFANLTDPDYESPWAVLQSEDVSGSGFLISDNRVITNAHVVANATFIAVRRTGEADKIPVALHAISYELDIAVLLVPDSVTWKKKLRPLRLALKVPHLRQDVLVAGFPEGGDAISVTKGIVSRIEPGDYTHSLQLLQVQIDAAINCGNSGGPVFLGNDEHVVGVAFAGLDDADGIGYIIPSILVNHFLQDLERTGSNEFSGFCSLGIKYQVMENAQLRLHSKMPEDMTGVLILWVDPLSPCYETVVAGDILHSVDNIPIANDGTVAWRKRERVCCMTYVFKTTEFLICLLMCPLSCCPQ